MGWFSCADTGAARAAARATRIAGRTFTECSFFGAFWHICGRSAASPRATVRLKNRTLKPEADMSGLAKLGGSIGMALVAGLLLPASTATPAAQSQARPNPTFTKDVLPILQRSCQKCHRPNSAAPMSLLTYQDVRPWVRAIRQRVSTRQMPPWHIDRSIGEYADDPSLTDAEIATIVSWVDNGAA